ncbi:sensor histidine kinase [Acuticoccus kandeliae]|uniref:sensor histidine kinase n=1 Tax=Acuticoccus kandeliae TaxID=2073160 RepID=UPI000D3E8E16|nr:HAMP domain-containing sensor histidine kinase [Acuticoccus kandeliae]
MNSLRTRITALLIVAIFSVVGLATLAAYMTLHPPRPEATVEPIAKGLHLIARLASVNATALDAAGAVLSDTPANGENVPFASAIVTEALASTGPSRPVQVVERPGRADYLASIQLESGRWLIVPFPRIGPPPGGWSVFAVWIAFIVVGSALVSAFAAAKVIRPLRLIESAVAMVQPDGTLPRIEVTGPVEARATAAALNRLSTRLKRATESRVRMVAAAGHDLRTPMTRMRLRAEFLPDDERDKWLADLAELDAIADSAILLVREEAGHSRVEAVDLSRSLARIANELCELGHAVALARVDGAQVRAAPVALKRALRNLMVNAATHGGGATVSLETSRTEAIVTICDEGPGIPPALIDQVFEPFFRARHARSKAIPGAGLGLAIAREIIERAGGTIVVRNRTPHGLEQVVRLPLTGSGTHPKADTARMDEPAFA